MGTRFAGTPATSPCRGRSTARTALVEQAFGHYTGACVLCHGAPGVKPARWTEINPAAPDLVQAGPRCSDGELFWIVKNGIKMTGMPALAPTHGNGDLWAIVASVRQLPTITPESYAEMKAKAGPGMDTR